LKRHLIALAAYTAIAIAFAWPLPARLGSTLPGPIAEDTGVYVWNLWLFRHEIVAHHQFPFATIDILSLTPPVPLALHNYTTLADIIAFPILPVLGTVRTFNLLVLASGVLAAYAMFLFARRAVADDAAAWIAGLVFGYSAYMSARTIEHFSLIQTAPLVLFAYLFERACSAPTARSSVALGATVAVAFLCDPYYAVYCLLMGAFAIAFSAIDVRDDPTAAPPTRHWLLNGTIAALGALVLTIAVTGGGRIDAAGVRISMTQLYTPVLLLTIAIAFRAWAGLRGRVSLVFPFALPPVRVIAISGLVCAAALAPILFAVGSPVGERQWISPKIFWRSSAPGLDLLAFVAPNPFHPWFGAPFQAWLRQLPHTYIENAASIPWTVIALVAMAFVFVRASAPRYWVAFTVFFASLSLGPFVHVGGLNLYVPTPWALLRYLPVVGAARMPTRVAAVVMFGVAMLAAFAVKELRARAPRPGLLAAAVSALLVFELLPAPRTVHSAAVPELYRTVAADPRPVVLLNLPFGFRDGMTSHGSSTSTAQYFQTVHEKPILGGYISRLPADDVAEYLRRQVTSALIDLSEGRSLTPERRAAVIRRAHDIQATLNIGYVVANTSRASAELIQFAREAFDLTPIAAEGDRLLFRTPLAAPQLAGK
jgi:hypothetical protein